jgi:hypothetical protein
MFLKKIGGAKQTLRNYLKELKIRGLIQFAPYSSDYTVDRFKVNELLANPPETFVRTHGSTFFQSRLKTKVAKRSTVAKGAESQQLAHRATIDETALEAMIEVQVLNAVTKVLNPATQVLNVATERLHLALSKVSESASQEALKPEVLTYSLLQDSSTFTDSSFCAVAIAPTPLKKSVSFIRDPFMQDQGTLPYASYSQSTAIISSVNNVSSPVYIAHPEHSWLLLDSLVAPTVMVIQTSSEPWSLSREDKQRGKIARALAEQWKSQGYSLRVTLEQQNDEEKEGSGVLRTGPMSIGSINANVSVNTRNKRKASEKGVVQTALIPAVLVVDSQKEAKAEEDRRSSALYRRITMEWRGYKLPKEGQCIDEQKKCRTLVRQYSDQDIADIRTYLLTETFRYQQDDQKYKVGASAILDESNAALLLFAEREKRGEPRIQPKDRQKKRVASGGRSPLSGTTPSFVEQEDTFANVPIYDGKTSAQIKAETEANLAFLREQGIAV